MDGSQTIKPNDILSYLGRDYIVEGLLTYQLPDRTLRLARAVDGDVVLWVEPLAGDTDDRVRVLTEVGDLAISVPPPQSISYRGNTFLLRFSGMAKVGIAGPVTGRSAGAVDVWRYRAAGDLFLQIEASASGQVVLYGESVHKGMIDVLPGK